MGLQMCGILRSVPRSVRTRAHIVHREAPAACANSRLNPASRHIKDLDAPQPCSPDAEQLDAQPARGAQRMWPNPRIPRVATAGPPPTQPIRIEIPRNLDLLGPSLPCPWFTLLNQAPRAFHAVLLSAIGGRLAICCP